MPSPAQREGMALLDAMTPAGRKRPEASIRARREPWGPAIGISVLPHVNKGSGGEYYETIAVPYETGRRRETALARLAYHLRRWHEIEDVTQAALDETIACDMDDLGNSVDDDMPTPAWRFHCPLPLRAVMDRLRMPDQERVDLAEQSGAMEHEGWICTIHERDSERTSARRGRLPGFRTVRRVTIRREGVYFSQGINRAYLRLDRELPETVLAALDGRPVAQLMEMPGLEAPDITIVGHKSEPRRGRVTFDIARTFTMMAGTPALRRT